jgi:hypothetical protein
MDPFVPLRSMLLPTINEKDLFSVCQITDDKAKVKTGLGLVKRVQDLLQQVLLLHFVKVVSKKAS